MERTREKTFMDVQSLLGGKDVLILTLVYEECPSFVFSIYTSTSDRSGS